MYVNLPAYIPDETVNKVEEMAKEICGVSGFDYVTESEEKNIRDRYIRLLAEGKLEEAAWYKAVINYIDLRRKCERQRELEIQERKERKERDERKKQRIKEEIEAELRKEWLDLAYNDVPWRPH